MKLEKVKLDIPKFRSAFSNLKFIHLSDLHIAKFGFREKKLVSLVNREKADLILISGDLVVNYKNDFSGCIETLRKLKAQYGVFAVFGNADHTFNPIQHLHDFVHSLKTIDVTILINQNIELKLGGNKLFLIGVDDPFYHFDNFEEAVKGVPLEAPTILLSHSPDILFPRTEALVVNLLDSPVKKDHFKEWGWEDSTYYGPDHGNVYFQNSGSHTIRVQSRQDGVSIDTILLNPYKDIDSMLESKYVEEIDDLLKANELPEKYPDLVIIPALKVNSDNIHGKWKKKRDLSTLFSFRLDDMPPRKWHYQPSINPTHFFEADFTAKKDEKYHVWIRMKAFRGNPKNDSVYLQFNDSADEYGKKKYRIGLPARSKEMIGQIDLILAGHTHGGQIRVPFYGPVVTMTAVGKKYAAGLYRYGKSVLYVSRGIGTSMLPLRLFCPPEITVFNFN